MFERYTEKARRVIFFARLAKKTNLQSIPPLLGGFYFGTEISVQKKRLIQETTAERTLNAAGILLRAKNTCCLLKGDFQQIAKHRFQQPTPFRDGAWWWIRPWIDDFSGGKHTRKQKRMKVARAHVSEREAKRLAAELLRPMNQGLETIGSAMSFGAYVTGTYKPTVLPQLANTTRSSYEGTLSKYLMPAFESMALRDMSGLTLQKNFSGMATGNLSGDTVLGRRERNARQTWPLMSVPTVKRLC